MKWHQNLSWRRGLHSYTLTTQPYAWEFTPKMLLPQQKNTQAQRHWRKIYNCKLLKTPLNCLSRRGWLSKLRDTFKGVLCRCTKEPESSRWTDGEFEEVLLGEKKAEYKDISRCATLRGERRKRSQMCLSAQTKSRRMKHKTLKLVTYKEGQGKRTESIWEVVILLCAFLYSLDLYTLIFYIFKKYIK